MAAAAPVAGIRPARSRWKALGRIAKRKPLGTFSVGVLTVFVLVAVFAGVLAPYHPEEGSSKRVMQAPSFSYPFGTDNQGRDLLSRVMFGARVSLRVGLMAVGMGTAAGVVIGMLSGYFGGWLDTAVQRLVDAMMAIPLILLAVVIVSMVEPSLNNVMIALAIGIAPNQSRVVRGATLSIKQNQYVEAARAIGCTDGRIVLRYILPNVFAPIIVIASVTLGGAIIAEASLSFLGLGPPTIVSWGNMLSSEGRAYMERAPWIAIFPGLAIMITVLSFNLLGDSLRDILDPRLRT